MAQTTQNHKAGKQQATGKMGTTKKQKNPQDSIFSLSDTSAHNAFANRQAVNRLYIADPVIRALNAKANGAPINFGSSGLIGVPKGTYGFANGRIAFYLPGATSSGTTTGSGSVGTGTSPGGFSTLGPSMGVNGKSPYTGPGAYGTRIPTAPILPLIKDVTVDLQNKKQLPKKWFDQQKRNAMDKSEK